MRRKQEDLFFSLQSRELASIASIISITIESDDEGNNTYLYRLRQGLLEQQGRELHAQRGMRNDSLISIVSIHY